MATFVYLPPQGSSPYWQDPVADVASLPASGNYVGEIIHVLSPHSLYYWDGAAWAAMVAGPAGTYVLKAGDTMAGDLTISTLTASRALVTNGSKTLASSATTATEIGYVNGVTSAIQTQIDGKQPLDSDLTALAGLSTTGVIARTGSGTAATRTITAGSSKLSVSNGSGVSGDPTLDVVEANLSLNNLGGGPLSVANGGTNSTTALNNNRVMQSSGGKIQEAAAITASRALASDSNGIPVAATTTATELDYVSGVTSAIQTQFGTKVTGPGSATDEALMRYDGTTGKLAQDSAVTLSDAGIMTMTGTTGFLRLANLTTTQRDALTAANGAILYNATTNKVQVYENGSWLDVTGWGS